MRYDTKLRIGCVGILIFMIVMVSEYWNYDNIFYIYNTNSYNNSTTPKVCKPFKTITTNTEEKPQSVFSCFISCALFVDVPGTPAPGTRAPGHLGTRAQGTRHPTPGTRHPTPDTQHPTPDTRHFDK